MVRGHSVSLADSETRDQIARDIQANRRRAYLVDDLLSPVITAILWLTLPFDISESGRVAGAAVIVAIIPVLIGLRRFGRADRRNLHSAMIRIVVSAALAGLYPVMWHAAAVLIGGSLIFAVVTESRSKAVIIGAASVVGLTVTGIVGDVSYWYLSVAVVILTGFGVESSHREYRQQQAETERRYDELVDQARMFVWEIDKATGNLLNVTGSVHRVLGYHRHEMVGRHWSEVIDPKAVARQSLPKRTELAGHSTVRAIHRDGHPVALREMLVDSSDENVVRGISTDVTELAELNDALQRQADHDALTGLHNRAVLERELTEAINERADNRQVALILIDLDRFKEVNDTLGHLAGDRLLRIVAQRLNTSVPDVHTVARIGGDEFALIAAGDLSSADIVRLGQQVHEVVAGQIEFDGIRLAVSCSVGIAISPEHGDTEEQLLSKADMAAYVAKRAGGGVRLFESTPDVMSVRRLQLTADIPDALARDEFKLYMQPLVDLSSGRIVGAEGLARWQHPEYGLLMPADFLEVLEVSADYHRFTAQMLERAVELAAACDSDGYPLRVAVNLGSMSFRNHDLPQQIASLLAVHRLPAERLTLEVTETDLLDEGGDSATVFAALDELGVRLSIDDFGTGYSSMQRLRALDIDEVKIDRSFVQSMCTTQTDAIIVDTVIRLAQALDHDVVAEGIETSEQLEQLRELGCTTGQGYLFSRPIPAEQLFDMIADAVGTANLAPRD